MFATVGGEEILETVVPPSESDEGKGERVGKCENDLILREQFIHVPCFSNLDFDNIFQRITQPVIAGLGSADTAQSRTAR